MFQPRLPAHQHKSPDKSPLLKKNIFSIQSNPIRNRRQLVKAYVAIATFALCCSISLSAVGQESLTLPTGTRISIARSTLWGIVFLTFAAGAIVGTLSNLVITSLLKRAAAEKQQARREQEAAERTQLRSALTALEIERKDLKAYLRQLAYDLTQADRDKDEFIATLAHELRNPLAPIRNGLQILQKADPDSSMVPLAKAMMERQVSLLVRLIDDLLDVSRVSRGKIELTYEQVDVKQIIERAIETSGPAIEAAQHTIRQIVPPQPLEIRADALRLTQVISNLLNNACKYSEPGKQIIISARQEGKQIRLSVKDEGIGISAEMMPKIFDMFTQAQRTLGRTEGGLGVGLTLVKQLVEMHGGSVRAISAGIGQGSEFILHLPISGNPMSHSSNHSPHTSTDMNTRRILVVDDNEDSALSLSLLFEITGDQTHTVHDGAAAVSAAESFHPDIILLDIGLPKMDGYEAAKAIRQQPWGQDMIIVALTGWGQQEDRRKSKAAGFNAHLVKPVDHDQLLQQLTELSEKPKSNASESSI